MPARKIQNKKPAAKKQKVAPVEKTEYDLKLEKLIAALSNEEYPIEGGATNRDMLIKGAPHIFCEFVEDRHDNQKVLGGFIDEAMTGIRKHLEGKIAEQQALADSADARKAELQAESERLTAALTEREAATVAATEARDGQKTILAELKEALKTANDNAKASKTEMAAAEKELARLNRGKELLTTLIGESRDAKMIKELTAILKTMELQHFDRLVEDLPLQLRGFFFQIAHESAFERFAALIGEINTRIAEINARDAPLIEAITLAEANLEQGKLSLEASVTALDEAKAAQREAKMALNGNEAALLNHDNDVAMADERKMHCNVDLEKFTLVEETLTWLKVRTAPVPEPEIIEDDKPAEEAAADVNMAEAPVAETTAETEAAPAEAAPIEEPIIEEAPLEQPMMA